MFAYFRSIPSCALDRSIVVNTASCRNQFNNLKRVESPVGNCWCFIFDCSDDEFSSKGMDEKAVESMRLLKVDLTYRQMSVELRCSSA